MKYTILIGLLIAGCSASPASLGEPAALAAPPEPVSQELDQLDRELQTYIEATALPRLGTPLVFALAVKEKSAAMMPLWSRYESFVTDENPRIGGRARYTMAQILLNFGCEIATIQIEDELAPEVVEKTREGLNKNVQEWLGKSREWASSATGSQGYFAEKAVELEQGLSDLTDPRKTCESISGWSSNTRPAGEPGKVSKKACLERLGAPVPACVEPLSAACKEGEALACYLVAKGEFKKSPKAGRDAFQNACLKGSASACKAQHGIALDEELTAYQNACKSGDPLGCLKSAVVLDRKSEFLEASCQADSKMPKSKTCESGDVRGCWARAAVLVSSTGPIVFGEAKESSIFGSGGLGMAGGGSSPEQIEKTRSACLSGSASSCMFAGIQAEQIKEDPIEWYRKGCVPDHPFGCRRLADHLLLQTDKSLTKEAVSLLVLSCRSGDEMACQRAAELFNAGERVRRNTTCVAALAWQQCSPDFEWGCTAINRLLAPEKTP